MLFWRSCFPHHFLLKFYCRSQSFSTVYRPPTTSYKAPTKAEWIFHPISAATEWIEDYRPGGRQYYRWRTVQDPSKTWLWIFFDRMAGTGGPFRYFWLMPGFISHQRSFRECQYVAINVSVAGASEMNSKLGIFEHLAPHRDQGGARYVMELPRSFEHKVPNGRRHLFLVFPVMGPSASTMEEKFRTNPTRSGRYSLWIAKSMLK
jgi:hypothetical protein